MNFVIHINTLIINSNNQVLLVNEKKEKVLNKLNLPGGKLEPGENLIDGAKREALEEVGIDIKILGLLGVYTGRGNDHYINFTFKGRIIDGEPVANKKEINGFGWYSIDEVLNMPDDEILNPKKLRKIIAAYQSGRLNPLDCIEENIYPEKH